MEDYTQGTTVGAPLVPGSPQDTYATHFAALGHGGWRSVADIAARDAITADRRDFDMQVKCVAENLLFELKGGLANENWVEVSEDFTKKIESTDDSPQPKTKVWHGTQSEFKAILNAGLLEDNVEYNYIKDVVVIKKPPVPVSFILTEFDNETIQIIETSCNLQLPQDVVDFNCVIVVTANGLTVNVYGADLLLTIPKVGEPFLGDSVLVGAGRWHLYQKGLLNQFVLC